LSGRPEPGDDAWSELEARSRRRRPLTIAGAIVGGLVALVVILGFVVTVPYVIMSPGSATPVDDVVSVDGAPAYEHRGALLFLTVSISRGKPNLWRFAAASLDDDAEVMGWDDYYGDTNPRQERRANEAAMTSSQEVATVVALEKLGYELTGTGAIVVAVEPGAPARGELRRGDVIIAVDGRPVTLAREVGPIVREHEPGDVVRFTVERGGETLDVDVTTAAAEEQPFRGDAYVGIGVRTRDEGVDAPVEVEIDAGRVGGPSAGLAFTLAILDEMTPGNLTGGDDVAVTGAITSEGGVREVGGVAQKAVAAREAGARLMLVPRPEVELARARAGDMSVVGVRTLDDALRALRRHGGDPLEVPAEPAA
jgi:PDZ domain-containing protein